MPLQKQTISISFGQGVDTKTDPNQVLPGKLVSAQNIVFKTANEFQKRNGNALLASLSKGVNASTFKSELVAFDGTNLQSYSPSNGTLINKGAIPALELSTSSIWRTSTGQNSQDSAFHSSGLYLYVWQDNSVGAQYMVVSSLTGNQVVTTASLGATTINPRAWCIGNYLIVTFIDTSNNHLRYVSISTASLVAGSTTDISTLVNSSNPRYDGCVINNNLFLSWNGSDAGGAVRTTYIDRFLNLYSANVQSNETASSCIGVFADSTTTPARIWVVYHNGSNLRYFILSTNATLISNILAPTNIVAVGNVVNIIGYVSNNSANIFYEISNTYSYNSTATNFISTITANSTGVIGSSSTFMRSVGLISHSFLYSGTQYFVVAYNGAEQPTYFVVNSSGVVAAKIAYTNGGGYALQGRMTNVNSLNTTQFQFAYLFKELLDTQSGTVYTQTGVNSAVLTLSAPDFYPNVELGNNLNIGSGFLWSYDGYGPVEQNFHLFPENLGFTATTGSGTIAAQNYSYVALYEWLDNQGNIHRSGYGTPFSANLVGGGSTTGISVNIPTLRVTAKQGMRSAVNVTLYRTAPSLATNIYYKVSSITSPTLNDTTVDSVQITDTSPDASIVGNQLLYTNGGVVTDSGAPAPVSMTNFKNRLFIINSEDRNSLWFSKQTLENTPVEMSDSFTFFVDPRFGPMTALAVMDDKLIIFKSNAIFYMVGEGPDNTGANNDFSEAVFITSIVGTTNQRSIVLSQLGLMFQSNKGIWLLGRDLNVSYIGAAVEQYNSNNVTSAQVVPNTTQIRFTLDSGVALVYDYFFQQWAVFTNHNAAGATIFNNLFTFISPTGLILQENPGVFSDNGNPVLQSFILSWLSLAGLQGYERIYALYFLGNYLSPHMLNVSMAYDYNINATQQVSITPTSLYNVNYGNDPLYGATQFYGGNYPKLQYRINPTQQKCQALQITFQEQLDTTTPTFGGGLSLEAIAILIGRKSDHPRLPASNIFT